MSLLNRLTSLLAAAMLACGAAHAADATTQKNVKPKKPATSRQQLQNEAKGLALATETVEQITQSQLEIATRVMTGSAECEFNQRVDIDAVEGKPGVFKVAFNGRAYMMTPQETATGAVRLEDKQRGAMWLQIPVKSMLLDTKIGQRLVDSCTQAEQRAAVAAAASASSPSN